MGVTEGVTEEVIVGVDVSEGVGVPVGGFVEIGGGVFPSGGGSRGVSRFPDSPVVFDPPLITYETNEPSIPSI